MRRAMSLHSDVSHMEIGESKFLSTKQSSSSCNHKTVKFFKLSLIIHLLFENITFLFDILTTVVQSLYGCSLAGTLDIKNSTGEATRSDVTRSVTTVNEAL